MRVLRRFWSRRRNFSSLSLILTTVLPTNAKKVAVAVAAGVAIAIYTGAAVMVDRITPISPRKYLR